TFPRLQETTLLEQLSDGTRRRKLYFAMTRHQVVEKLSWPPRRILLSRPDQELYHLWWRSMRNTISHSTHVVKSNRAVLLEAFEKLVSGFSADAELSAQVRHSLPVLDSSNKPHSFIHVTALFPGHGTSCLPPMLSPMRPV